MRDVPDRFGRELRDLRVSITDRCNFRCRYCMPEAVFGAGFKFLPADALLTFDEICRLVRLFEPLGVQKVRLTGGEPLLRRGLCELVSRLAGQGELEVALTTNGMLLERMAGELRAAGLQRVNVSLDALEPAVFRKINGGRGAPEAVVAGIEAAEQAGLKVKVNCVAQRGVNGGELAPLARLCRQRGWVLRFIEYMDVGNVNGWREEDVTTGGEVRAQLEETLGTELMPLPGGSEVARYWRYADTGQEVGFIESVSKPFCAGCTRARISARGELLTCLFAERGLDLKGWLRGGASDDEVAEVLRGQWSGREDRYSALRKEARLRGRRKQTEMWQVGG